MTRRRVQDQTTVLPIRPAAVAGLDGRADQRLPAVLSETEIKGREIWHGNLQIKPLPKCVCGRCTKNFDPLAIFIERNGLATLRRQVQRRGCQKFECGGLLVGEICRQADNEHLFVQIENYIFAENAKADESSLQFTGETWHCLLCHRLEHFPNSRVVGWFHTHLLAARNCGGTLIQSALFFSHEDRELHRAFFPQPWQVALVLDATSDEMVFFRWEAQDIVKTGHHYYEDEDSPTKPF